MSLNTPLRDWRDRRVWIVGASTGIGAALAEALAIEGAKAGEAEKARRIAEADALLA